jgi:hypothetical protein
VRDPQRRGAFSNIHASGEGGCHQPARDNFFLLIV